MSINTPVSEAINAYLARKAPGFALLLDAPWGAGKTHFIKSVTKCDTNHRVHYVTLNGVDAPTGFRRALMASMPASKLAMSTGTLGKALSDLAGIGDLGSFAQNAIEDHAIANLPDAIIFDDLERCTMEAPVLLGLLNEFVEHQDKNIILIANIAEYPDKDLFLSRQEKVVGRTVRLTPEAGAVLGVFIGALPDGAGKDWMTENKDVVLQVFHDSESHNLRILRQVVHDCAAVLDQIDDVLMAAKHAVKRFVVTYLALAIALIGNEISAEEVKNRDDYSTFRSAEDDEPAKMWNVSERHRHAELFAGNSANILPIGLGETLIVHGFMEREQLNRTLRETGQFEREEHDPLWRRAGRWWSLSHADLTELMSEIEAYIFETDEVDVTHFIIVANAKIELVGTGKLKDTPATALKAILDRIEHLHRHGLITSDGPKERRPWGTVGGRISYKDYNSAVISGAFGTIITAIEAALDSSFEASLPSVATELCQLFKEDLSEFSLYFSSYEAYAATPILHHFDAQAFSKHLLDHIRAARNDVGAVTVTLSERHNATQNWETEKLWAAQVKVAIEAEAAKLDCVTQAMVQHFLQYLWRFDPPQKKAAAKP